jgi:hypothetical protein
MDAFDQYDIQFQINDKIHFNFYISCRKYDMISYR